MPGCPVTFDGLRVATEHLGDEIHHTPSPKTFFYNFVERGEFPKNKGVNMTTFSAGRVEPTDEAAGWSDVSLSANIVTGGACDSTYLGVDVGFDEATYKPRKLNLAGPTICREKLTYSHNPMAFIQGEYVPSLARYVKRKIDLELRNQAIMLGNKLVIRPGGFDSLFTGTTLPTIAPSSQLTLDWLDDVAMYMTRDGAANAEQEYVELGPDGPIFPIIMGPEMTRRLATNVPATRSDYQYADMGKGPQAELMKAMGATRVLRNFRIIPEMFPPRYDLVNGILTLRPTWENVSATHGVKSQLTSAYKNAAFEAAIIPHKQQFHANVVSPDNAGLEFDAMNYNGDWKFVTGGINIASDANCFDPMHDYGRHFARYVYAPEPIHTNYGWTIFFQRCRGDQATVGCTSGS